MRMTVVMLAVMIVCIIIAMIRTSQRRAIPCPSWLSWFVELENPFLKNNRSTTIIQQLDVQPGMKVTDIGCGPGRVTIPLAEVIGPSGRVTAVDIQQNMLLKVKNKAKAKGLQNIVFLRANISEANLEPDEMDRAVMVNVLGEVPDKEAALKEVFNTLKPGGMLCITEVILDPHFQSREKVSEWAASAGFHEKGFFGNKAAFSLCLEKAER